MRCFSCGKGRLRGHRVSHAKNRSIRFFKPNLHPARVIEAGKAVRRILCTRCIKKAKSVAKTPAPKLALASV